MLHIPILRAGKAYESIEKVELVHHATADPVAAVSQANSGMVSRDIGRMDDAVLERFTVAELIEMCKKAAELFATATLFRWCTQDSHSSRKPVAKRVECQTRTDSGGRDDVVAAGVTDPGQRVVLR